jgi:hypothetical protein
LECLIERIEIDAKHSGNSPAGIQPQIGVPAFDPRDVRLLRTDCLGELRLGQALSKSQGTHRHGLPGEQRVGDPTTRVDHLFPHRCIALVPGYDVIDRLVARRNRRFSGC